MVIMAFLHTTKGQTSATPGLMELSGLEDSVELGAEFHFQCLPVSWWFSFWKRGPVFNVHQFMLL